jgi:hypothetical protein
MINILLTSILLSFLGSYGNVIRGGLDVLNSNKIPHGVKRILIAMIPTFAILSPFEPDWKVWVISFPFILYFSLVAGWGTWFHIRSTSGWRHNFDAPWVEIILTMIMGKHWIPEGETSPREKGIGYFTVKKSRTGFSRSLYWYSSYNILGMGFRGLGFGLTVCGILLFLDGWNICLA